MKVYVDKGKLESYDIQQITDLGGRKFMQVRMWMEDTNNVEIVDLADHDKQVRKEVLGDLKEELKKNGKCSIRGNGTMDFFIEMNKLNQILDQTQGE